MPAEAEGGRLPERREPLRVDGQRVQQADGGGHVPRVVLIEELADERACEAAVRWVEPDAALPGLDEPVVVDRVVAVGANDLVRLGAGGGISAWGEIFGDEVVAVAMIDRLVHHAEIVSLRGDSYRLKDKELGARLSPPGESAIRAHPVHRAGSMWARPRTASP